MRKETENKLMNKNTRPTSMRILVYDFLNTQNVALSLSEVEEYFDHADRITIYRTLKTFEEKGIVHGIQEGQTTKYMLCDDNCDEHSHNDWHLHFYCKICKETTCREDVLMPQDLGGNFRIDETQFLVKGICEKCLSETE